MKRRNLNHPMIAKYRLEKVFKRKLQPSEIGILYRTIGEYGRDVIDESLDIIEDGKLDFPVTRISTFKALVEQVAKDCDEVIKESQDIKKAVSETKQAQNKAHSLLKDLL